jgi:hypothetical protein
MVWKDYASLIGAVSGVISLLGLIYMFGYKLGIIDTRLKNLESNQIDKETYGGLTQRVDTLYQVYVVEKLRIKAKPLRRGMSGDQS